MSDLIGQVLGAYSTYESAQISKRLADTEAQRLAYEQAAVADAKAAVQAVPKWVIVAGVAVAGLIVWKVMK